MVDAIRQENVHSWFYSDGPATVVGEGYSDVRARLWHEDGTLVAIGAQQFADFSGRASTNTQAQTAKLNQSYDTQVGSKAPHARIRCPSDACR